MEFVTDTTYKAEWEIPAQAWTKFMNDAFDMESDVQNFKYEFKTITKKYGRQYMEFCRAAWTTCKDIMTVGEFCTMNAGMPVGFFRAKIDVF